jgi:hypothetical protein
MDKIIMLKPGILEIHVGTGVIRSFQELINYIIKDVPAEEMQEYKDLFTQGTKPEEYPKEWMKHAFNVSIFVKMFQDAAHSQGLTYEKNVDTLSTLENLINQE